MLEMLFEKVIARRKSELWQMKGKKKK